MIGPARRLAIDLRQGRPLAWLQRLSNPEQPLQIYAVTPLAPPHERP